MGKESESQGRDILRKERKRRKLSQREVSKFINISRSAYSNIETGKRNPTLKVAIRIAKFYKIDVKKLDM